MAAYKAVPGNLIRGQDISITVIKDVLPVETVGPFNTILVDLRIGRDDDGYLAAKPGPPSDAGGDVDAAMAFGAVTLTVKSKPDAAFWEGLAARMAPEIKRKRAEVVGHMLRGGLFLHPVGFLARLYVSRTLTGAWLVRARCASLHGAGPVVTSRIRCRTRKLAMRAARRLLVPLLMVPGEDRPIDAVPLFAERDGSRVETAVGVVEFPGEVKCQACKRRGAKACAYKCGAVLCADHGAAHQPPDCPPQMAEIYEDQGLTMHAIRGAAADLARNSVKPDADGMIAVPVLDAEDVP